MILTIKQHIHLLQQHLLGLRNKEVHKRREQKIDPREHVKGVKAAVIEEGGEKLLHNGVGDVLGLGRHPHGLGADVHGEDLGGPDPDGGAPGGLVEEDEDEEDGDDADAGAVGFGAAGEGRGLGFYRGGDDHADAHADAADDEEEFAAEAVDGPGGVEGEEDAEGGVEGVDQADLGGFFAPDFLVDFGRVRVERALAGDLLARVEDEGEEETFAHGTVFPERRVGRGDGFLFEFEGFADHQDLVFDLLLRVADPAEAGACGVDVVALLDVPSRGAGDGREENDDDDRDEHLKYHDQLPVPFAQGFRVPRCSVIDPEADERPDRVKELPKGHDLAADFGRSKLADVNWPRGCVWCQRLRFHSRNLEEEEHTQRNALANTNDHSATDEAAQIAPWGKGLHEGCNNGEEATDAHAYLSAKEVGNRPTHEPSSKNGTDCVCC